MTKDVVFGMAIGTTFWAIMMFTIAFIVAVRKDRKDRNK